MASDDIIIQAPKLHPYVDSSCLVCAKCGEIAIARYVNYISAMIGKGTLSTFNVRYCAGGLEPTEEGQVAVVMGGQLVGGSMSQRNSCSGVMGEHLHVTCKSCGWEILSEVRP